MTPKNDNPYFRVFAMLYMLRADYSFFVHFSKQDIKKRKELGLIPKNGNKKGKETKEELIYFAELDFHQKIINEINRMHRATDYKHQAEIEKEMNSERIKDLHSFMDMILQVRNIEILTEVINVGLSGNKDLMFMTVEGDDVDANNQLIEEYKILIKDSQSDIARYEQKIEEIKKRLA